MLYYMFPYYGSECLSNNKSHSSNKFFYKNKSKKKKEKKLIRVQVMPNGNTFFETIPVRTQGSVFCRAHLWIHLRLPALEWRTNVFVWSAPESSVSQPPPAPPFFLFGHHGWTDKRVVVTAETVNTNADDMRPLEFILKGGVGGGFQGA